MAQVEEGEGGGSEEEEERVLGLWGSLAWLAIMTVFIALLSSYLVEAIEGASKS